MSAEQEARLFPVGSKARPVTASVWPVSVSAGKCAMLNEASIITFYTPLSIVNLTDRHCRIIKSRKKTKWQKLTFHVLV